MWSIWVHLFSAAVSRFIFAIKNISIDIIQIIVGSIVTRAPSSDMATGAYHELGVAIELFAKGAVCSSRAREAMVRAVLRILYCIDKLNVPRPSF